MKILVSNRTWAFCNIQKNTSSLAASLKNKLAQLHQGTRQNIPLLGVLPGSLKNQFPQFCVSQSCNQRKGMCTSDTEEISSGTRNISPTIQCLSTYR